MKFYILFFLSTLMLSAILYKLLLSFVKSLGIRNNGEKIIRWSAQAKPAIGGIGYFVVFLFSIIINEILFDKQGLFYDQQFLGILLGGLVAFMLGLSDDAFNTNPLLKFSSQLACGVILVYFDVSIKIFDAAILNYALTVFWVIGIMNSINMLDNMDAITTIVSIFLFMGLLLVSMSSETFNNNHVIIFTAMLATLVGFLFYNWHPSKMFMGDTGSQFLGFLLAAFSITYLWNFESASGIIVEKNIILVVIAFVLPIADTTTVSINRLSRGQSPFVGGRDHTTHHLNYLGCSDRQVALVFCALAGISVALLHFIAGIQNWQLTHTLMFGTIFLLIAGGMYATTRVRKARSKFLELSKS